MNKEQIQEMLKNKVIADLVNGLGPRLIEYRNNQKRFAKQIELNRLFYEGRQYNVLMPGSYDIWEPMQDDGEVRLVDNITKEIVNIMQSEILSRRPTPNVEPYAGDESKIEAANLEKQILKQYQNDFERSGKQAAHHLSVWIDGYSWLAVEYYPSSGALIGVDPQTQEPIHEGKIGIRLISALDVLIPDDYPDKDKAPCIIEVCRMHKSDLKKRFGIDVDVPTSGQSGRTQDRPDLSEKTKDLENEATVYKFYFMPGAGALPKKEGFDSGLCIAWLEASREVVDIQPFPYPYAELEMYPLLDFHADKRVDHFHSQGLPEQLMGMQTELNRTWNQIAEAKNYIGSPVWRYAKGQYTSPEEMPTYSGGHLIYNPQPGLPPPEPVAMPPIPSYISELPSRIVAAMKGVHSTSSISQAEQPGSVNSYSGLQLLSNIQSKVLAPYLADLAGKLATMFKIIGLMEQKYTDYQKQIRVVDDLGDMSIKSYYGADLLSDFDVVVQIESEVESQATKAQRALQEVQLQIIDPQEYKSRVYGEPENDQFKRDTIYHSQENEAMLTGQIIDNLPMVAFEDHNIGFKINRKVLFDPRFKTLPAQAQEAARRHVYIHQLGMQNPQALYQIAVMPELQKLGIAPVQPDPMAMGQQQTPQPKGPSRVQPLPPMPETQV